MCLVCLFCWYVLAYGGNLVLCTSLWHDPVEVVERDERQEERQEENGDDMEYYLTVRQRDSQLSIRMVDLHLPTEGK